MRLNHALVVLLFTIPLTAQEEPLPVVTARDAAPEVMLIATAVEPIREFRGPTLAEAARANDFISFDALYREARQRGEPVAPFETLHELWVYSVTNPIGAFYGTDMYEQLARAYPGYAQFIEDYSIVDSHGNVFYPTAETREFVLARAIEGRTARVLVASDLIGTPKPAPVDVDRSDRSDRAADAPVVAPRQRAGGRGANRSTATKAPAAPLVAEVAPVTAKVVPAPVVVPEVAATPVVAEAAPVVEDVPQPIVAAPPAPAQPALVETVPQPAAAADTSPTSRGLLLIVIGLLGIGLLAVMFRAPKETPVSILNQPAPKSAVKADEKPVAPVEPLRRPEGPQRATGKNRANG
ncbi:MAG TPA: hypothetical protein VE974_05405 [Thermoanaerobaculia bacterium]|nr:hypothetical protein [Thermoanaerobaculia bacterium]